MRIGISGFAQSGKSTAANILEQHGYVRKHIATPLRAMLVPLLVEFGIPFGTTGTQPGEEPNTYDYLEGRLKEQVIPQIGKSGRYLQIKLGTEWGREQVRDDLWVAAWDWPLTADSKVINDSVRFPNEENAIHDANGITIMIRRPGIGPRAFKWTFLNVGKWLYETFGIWWGVHDSERADRLMPDFTIDNVGTIEDLENEVLAILTCMDDFNQAEIDAAATKEYQV